MAGEIHEVCIDPHMECERRLREVDRAIAELAERQHGVVARRQLLAVGIGSGAIDRRVQQYRLHVVHRGVYAVGHGVLSIHGRWTAAVLASGPSAVLSHRSAGQAWKLTPPARLPIEVTRPTKSRGRCGIRAYRSIVPPDERALIGGLEVTFVPRTLLDLASVVTRHQLEKALNETEVRTLTDKLSIPDLLERYPRRRGSAVLRALIADGTAIQGITRNDLEGRFMALLLATDLPRPRLNADVAVRGRFFEADALWAEQRVIVELDGRAAHGTKRAFEKDRERDRLLLTDGWRVIRVTWRQLRDDSAAVTADLRELLRAKGQPPTL